MNSIERAANAIATILIREGIGYLQSKTVIKRTRAQAGLFAPPEKRTSIVSRLIEEELPFIDHAFAAGGTTGLLRSSFALSIPERSFAHSGQNALRETVPAHRRQRYDRPHSRSTMRGSTIGRPDLPEHFPSL
ncbi:hypothetical protein ABK249_31880 [Neorhizobium sp. Rsf11]|uniref:Uncharacterized protein n=1 Tax=Neorhizobium phenanthreniclasticum TaxID=3157917 RepID=A0ABV0MDG4_9HYPH|nr:hypothetical protein [Neorhizobium petrolearium]MCC2613921.1 hypothetical protein [Neorhizobium petrolearium]